MVGCLYTKGLPVPDFPTAQMPLGAEFEDTEAGLQSTMHDVDAFSHGTSVGDRDGD
jgi:hypothetical protein